MSSDASASTWPRWGLTTSQLLPGLVVAMMFVLIAAMVLANRPRYSRLEMFTPGGISGDPRFLLSQRKNLSLESRSQLNVAESAIARFYGSGNATGSLQSTAILRLPAVKDLSERERTRSKEILRLIARSGRRFERAYCFRSANESIVDDVADLAEILILEGQLNGSQLSFCVDKDVPREDVWLEVREYPEEDAESVPEKIQ